LSLIEGVTCGGLSPHCRPVAKPKDEKKPAEHLLNGFFLYN
jgi:hypothetical protein